MDQLQQELRTLVAELGEIPPDFDGKANLYLDLGVPSMKAMQLLMDLEDKYGVRIPDDQFVDAVSLEKLTALISGLMAEKSA
jgi:acyl carrier protein